MAFWISMWRLSWRCLCCPWLVSWSVCSRNFMVSARQPWEPSTGSLELWLVTTRRTCLPKGSFPSLELKRGSGEVFGVIREFLEIISQFSIDPTVELLCRQKGSEMHLLTSCLQKGRNMFLRTIPVFSAWRRTVCYLSWAIHIQSKLNKLDGM